MSVSEEEGNKKGKYVKGLTRTTAPLSSSLPSKNETTAASSAQRRRAAADGKRNSKYIRAMQITEVPHTPPHSFALIL